MRRKSRRLMVAAIEAMETRRLLSSSLLSSGTLAISGTSAADVITVSVAGSSIVVNEGIVTKSYLTTKVKNIAADLGVGNDNLTIASAIQIPSSLLGGSGNDTISAGSGKDTLRGGDGNDSLLGNSGDDLTDGQAGNDVLLGGNGNDTFPGETGNDAINGSAGNDSVDYSNRTTSIVAALVIGGKGSPPAITGKGGQKGIETDTYSGIETIIGGSAADQISFDDELNAGNVLSVPTRRLLLKGGGGADTLQTLSQNKNDHLALVTLQGGSGDDIFNIGGGAQTLVLGESGNDTLNFARWYQTAFARSVDMGSGTDLVTMFEDIPPAVDIAYTLPTNTENFNGTFNFFNNVTIVGNSLANKVDPHGPAVISVFGGDGDDNLYSGDNLGQVLGQGGDDIITGRNVVNWLDGGEGNDTLTGGSVIQTIFGGSGDDLIIGGNDNDELHGGAGNDTIKALGGDDTVLGDDGNDNLDAGGGSDSVIASVGQDTVASGGGTLDTYSCEAISGSVSYHLSITAANPGRVGGQVSKPAGGSDSITDFDVLVGTANGDGFALDDAVPGSGSGLSLRLDGGAGKDGFRFDSPRSASPSNHHIEAHCGSGEEEVYTASSDDIVVYGEADDDAVFVLEDGKAPGAFIGGTGNDILDIQQAVPFDLHPTFNMEASLDRLSVIFDHALKTTVNVAGNALDNFIHLAATNATIDAGAGNDLIYIQQYADQQSSVNGGLGNDTVNGGAGADSVDGGGGDDVISGSGGNDNLRGGKGNDTLKGGDGNDTLFGEDGSDLLQGENGNDRLNDFTGILSKDKDTLDGGAGSDAADNDKTDVLVAIEKSN